MLSPPSSGPGSVFRTAVSLTTAQILGWNATPITLIGAPGAGLYILPIAVSLNYQAGATPFTVDGTTTITIEAAGGASWLVIGAQGFIDQAASQMRIRLVPTVNTSASSLANRALRLIGSGTLPTLGNGAIVAGVTYTVEAAA